MNAAKNALRGATLFVIATLLVACPLPFQFTPSASTGNVAGSNDPANPSVTAAPAFVVTEITSGHSVTPGTTTITSTKNISIGFESSTRGAVIFYTTDGAPPVPGDSSTRQYDPASPIRYETQVSGKSISAIAVGPSMYPSQTTTYTVSVAYDQVAAPTFSPEEGNYSVDQSVTIATTTPGAKIYYTIATGTDAFTTPHPGESGTHEYSGAISISGTGTAKSISAIAVATEMTDSDESHAWYSIGYPVAAKPVISPASGTVPADTQITITSTTSGAVLHYTTDGSAPTSLSPVYAGPFELSSIASLGETVTIRAITTAPTYAPSSAASATYTSAMPDTATPTGLTASQVYQDRVALGWDAVSNASDYQVWRSSDGSTYTEIANSTDGVTSYSDTTGTTDTHYYYAVSADVGLGTNSARSAPAIGYRTSLTFWYVTGPTEPWGFESGTGSNPDALDRAFGAGNWSTVHFSDYNEASITPLLQPNRVIIIDGSYGNDIESRTLLVQHGAELSAWVAAGGKLFLNIAPVSDSDGPWSLTLGSGTNQTTFSIEYDTTPDLAVVLNSALTSGGQIPFDTSTFQGNQAAHAWVSRDGSIAMTALIEGYYSTDGSDIGPILVEAHSGSGTLLMGGMTVPWYHTPQEDAANLRANIFSYLRTR